MEGQVSEREKKCCLKRGVGGKGQGVGRGGVRAGGGVGWGMGGGGGRGQIYKQTNIQSNVVIGNRL